MKKTLLIPLSLLFYIHISAQTLQQVTDAGNVTNQTITVNGVEAAGGFTRYYSNGAMNSFIGSDASAFGQGGDDAIHYVYGNNKFHIATGAVRRFTVDGTGNVGIGTQYPDNAQGWHRVLNLHGTNHAKLLVTENSGVKVGIYSHAGYNGKIGTESNHNLTFTAGYWNDVMTLTTQGNMGIGTLDPQGKLDVFNATNTTTTPLLSIRSDFHTPGNYGMIRFGDYTQTSQYQKGAIIYESVAASARGKFHIALENTDGSGSVSLSDAKLTVLSNGQVGIGTTTPSEMLSVNGKIRAREIKVEASPWPDYVFESSYKLPDLKATEQFIKENNHLPEIPSAAEVAKDGVSLGEMNALLLKKIEEMTLYLIEQNKKTIEQSKRLDEYKLVLQELQASNIQLQKTVAQLNAK